MSQHLFCYLDFPLPLVPRKLPDHTLSPEFAVELWIQTFTTLINVKALATVPAEARLMFLTDRDRLSIRMIPAFHGLRQPMLTSSSFTQS